MAFVSPFLVVHHGWLSAEVVESGSLIVMRSPMLKDSDAWYSPVREYISENRLVLGCRWEEQAPNWMFGRVEVSVFVSPRSRNGVYGLLADLA